MSAVSWRGILIVGLVSWGLAGPGSAKVTFIKVKFPHDNVTEIDAINTGGAVAGQHGSGFADRAFVRASDGTFVDFAVDGAVVTIPRGLTDEGAVGGRYDLPDDSIHGFLRDSAGNLTPFDGPGLGAREINGINAGNDIVGTYFRDEQQNLGGFIRHNDGSFTLFRLRGDTPDGLRIVGIDANGEVAGYYSDSNFVTHAFLRNAAGKITKFQAPDAVTNFFGAGTDVLAISSSGWVTGSYTARNANRHYLRDPKGRFEEFDLPGGESNQTTSVNDSGELTGCYSSNFQVHGFIRQTNGKVITFDLPWGTTENMCLETINNAGLVAGYARYGAFGKNEIGFIRIP